MGGDAQSALKRPSTSPGSTRDQDKAVSPGCEINVFNVLRQAFRAIFCALRRRGRAGDRRCAGWRRVLLRPPHAPILVRKGTGVLRRFGSGIETFEELAAPFGSVLAGKAVIEIEFVHGLDHPVDRSEIRFRHGVEADEHGSLSRLTCTATNSVVASGARRVMSTRMALRMPCSVTPSRRAISAIDVRLSDARRSAGHAHFSSAAPHAARQASGRGGEGTGVLQSRALEGLEFR